MKWLLTTRKQIDSQQLVQKLTAWGCAWDAELQAIPLGEDEQVFQINGPRDLPQKVQGDAIVLSVYPNSEMTLYTKSGSK